MSPLCALVHAPDSPNAAPRKKHKVRRQCAAHPRWRRGLMGGLAAMEDLCLSSERWMTPSACKSFERSYLIFRTCLNNLARRAYDLSVLRYHIRPKLHFLGHLVYHFLPKNPRHMACFLDEDFVARSKRLALKCHPVYMSQQVIFRYSVHICLKWNDLISG